MSRKYGMSKAGKIALVCCLLVVAAVAIFFIAALIVGQQNGLTCIEQIQSWFGIVKEVAESTPVEDVVEAAKAVII